MISKTKLSKYITAIILIIVSFVIILSMCNNTISDVKIARAEQTTDARKRDFEVVWNVLETFQAQARTQAEAVSKNIEEDIYDNFNLEELHQKLDEGDPAYTEKLYQLISKNVQGVYLNSVKNNRNAMIVLEGYDTIIEDLLVDPESREEGVELKDPSTTSLYKYRDTTYNRDLFDSAIRKIRNHTDSTLIALEPYNYIEGNHEKINEATYETLERIYVNEGFAGFKNYQFLVPVYITDTGDIFGQADTVHGVKVDNHKFIVIQTFNLYDQLMTYKPDFGDDDYLHRMNMRYDTILNSLNILGIVTCALIVFITLYFLSIYNALVTKDFQISNLLKDLDIDKTEADNKDV